MLRKPMRRMRIARRLADLCAWCLIVGAGIFVVAWWAENATAVIGRIAAWSSPAPDVSRPPEPARLGPRKKDYFDRIKKAVKAKGLASAAESP
jgi:hypothetical protein